MKLMDKVNDWAARLAGARASMHELHETDRQLREAHQAATHTHDALVSAPPPADEVVAAMEAEVDRLAAAWATEHAGGLVTSFGPGLKMNADGTLTAQRPQCPTWFVMKPMTLLEFTAAFPELAKPRWEAMIRGYAYAAGPAQADRAREVAAADAKILEIEEEHTRLVDMAATFEPPIVLELLPAVKERRAAEQAQRERMARVAAAENRPAREAAIDGRHAARVSRSAYIDQH